MSKQTISIEKHKTVNTCWSKTVWSARDDVLHTLSRKFASAPCSIRIVTTSTSLSIAATINAVFSFYKANCMMSDIGDWGAMSLYTHHIFGIDIGAILQKDSNDFFIPVCGSQYECSFSALYERPIAKWYEKCGYYRLTMYILQTSEI